MCVGRIGKADGKSHWHDVIGERDWPGLKDCMDVNIGITPATNARPIKRLRLSGGASQVIFAAYVPLPEQINGDFLLHHAAQRYTWRKPDKLYRYEDLSRNITAELDVDEDGLVVDYPNIFRRVVPSV